MSTILHTNCACYTLPAIGGRYAHCLTRILGISLLIIGCSFHFTTVSAQSKLGFEQYNYIRQPEESAFVPMMHFQTKNNWYAELRYNYEDLQTVSLFAGKTFSGGNAFEYSLIPMIGYSVGRFSGVSFATTTEASWKNFFIWGQTQYSIGNKKSTPDFFFNWSELGYNVSDYFFAGLAMQYTSQEGEQYFDPGFVAGLNWKNVSAPFYVFSPFKKSYYFVLGLNYEYNPEKKNKSKKNISTQF